MGGARARSRENGTVLLAVRRDRREKGPLDPGEELTVVVAVAAVYLVSSLAIRKTYRFPDSAVRAATDSASLAWGRHLMEAVTKCQECLCSVKREPGPLLGGIQLLIDAV